ncbi:hypothetical protein ACQBAR_13385 [Propionibacteriaceae bacterium Y1685]
MDVVPITQLATDGRPSAQVIAAANMHRRWHLHHFGHDDLADSADTRMAIMRDSPDRRKIWLSAVVDDRLVADAMAALSLNDNLHSAGIEMNCDPDVPAAEVLPALWDSLRERLLADNRTTIQTWTAHPNPGPLTTDSLTAASGVGHLDRDETTDVLTSLGFSLEQTERHSTLVVADALARLDAHEATALAKADESYETLSWVGRTPPELLDRMAELRARMSVDVPMAGLEFEIENWDAERVERYDQRSIDAGRTRVSTAARHRRTGQLVAYTEFEQPRDKPACGYQEDTLVHGDHRGHRLGLLIKVRNLRALAEHTPQVERIHTWNAGENDHMLSINVALGFEPAGAEGAWQLKLDHLRT